MLRFFVEQSLDRPMGIDKTLAQCKLKYMREKT